MNKYRVALNETASELTVSLLEKETPPDVLTVADIEGENPENALQMFVTNGGALFVLRQLEENLQQQRANQARLARIVRPGTHIGLLAAAGRGFHWTNLKTDLLRELIPV